MHNLKFYYTFFLAACLVALSTSLQAQQDTAAAVKDTMPVIDYSQQDLPILPDDGNGTYEIGGITIIGAVNRDRNAIKSLAMIS